MARVTVIGLGNMGSAVASALLGDGHEVTVWNRTSRRAAPLQAKGAVVARSPAEAIAASSLVVLVLLDYPATRSLLKEPDVLAVLAGRTVLQVASGGPEESVALARWVTERGADYLDGGIRAYPHEVGSGAAELGVGGAAAVFERHAGVLRALGTTRYLGEDVARGAVLFAAHGALMECVVASFHETLAYALAGGVAVEQMADALPQTLRIAVTTINETIANLREEPLGRVEATQAALRVHESGVAALASAMTDAGCRSDMVKGALEGLRRAREHGLGDFEISAVMAMHEAHRRRA